MDTACLAHVLTEEERSTFDRDGYFVIEGALSPEQVQHFVAGVDAVDARYRLEHGLAAEERLNPHDTIGYDERFLLLIDWPTTFPKVWGILGWSIQLYHTQMVISPPLSTSPENKRLGWHQDNNP